MQIGQRQVGIDQPPLIIAEIGNNHDGSLGQALALIDAAADAGAGAVKFQTHIAEAEMLPSTPTPPHFSEPRYSFTKRMELSREDHIAVKQKAEERGVLFLSSPFSVEAVELLETIDCPAYKIASGEVTNPPLIDVIAKTGKPVLISSGMSGMDELTSAIGRLRDAGAHSILPMQCTSAYPCPPEQVNLKAIPMLAERFSLPVGLSDHTADIYTSIAAISLGAVCIEKHFTLSKRLYGPDHQASLEPADLARLVDGALEAWQALGTGDKLRDPSLDPVRMVFEKSIVSRMEIPAGTKLTMELLTTKRPGSGIPAIEIDNLMGRTTSRDVGANELILETDLV